MLLITIAIISITLFVHWHTYICPDYYHATSKEERKQTRIKTPIWIYIMAVTAACIPIVNVACFLAGLFMYVMCLGDEMITFSAESDCKIMKFLNKRI